MIFSIAMGAEYLFYMKSIETHAPAFLALIILGIGTVIGFNYCQYLYEVLIQGIQLSLL